MRKLNFLRTKSVNKELGLLYQSFIARDQNAVTKKNNTLLVVLFLVQKVQCLFSRFYFLPFTGGLSAGFAVGFLPFVFPLPVPVFSNIEITPKFP
jgi:hypothetical protein